MFRSVEFLFNIYKGIKEDSNKLEFLRAIIIAEAKVNNDLVNVIFNSNPKTIAESTPRLFEQFDTTSFELLSALGISYHDIFDDKKPPLMEDLSELDKSDMTLKKFMARPKSELYEFYIRKTMLLAKLSKANAIASASVGLKTRIKNIKFATHSLIQRSK